MDRADILVLPEILGNCWGQQWRVTEVSDQISDIYSTSSDIRYLRSTNTQTSLSMGSGLVVRTGHSSALWLFVSSSKSLETLSSIALNLSQSLSVASLRLYS